MDSLVTHYIIHPDEPLEEIRLNQQLGSDTLHVVSHNWVRLSAARGEAFDPAMFGLDLFFSRKTVLAIGLEPDDFKAMLPLVLGAGGTLTSTAAVSAASHVIVGGEASLEEADVERCAEAHRAGLPLLQPHWVFDALRHPKAAAEQSKYTLTSSQIPGLEAALAGRPPEKASPVKAEPYHPASDSTPALAAGAAATPPSAKRPRIEVASDGDGEAAAGTAAAAAGDKGDELPQFLRGCFFIFDQPRTLMRRQPDGTECVQASNLVCNLIELGAKVLVVTDSAESESGSTAQYDSRCTHIIVDVMDGEAYHRGVEESKLIVSSMWCDELFFRMAYFEPQWEIHSPLKGIQGVEGCVGMVFSFSGYSGRERIDLKHIVVRVGGHHKASFSRSSHVLICASPNSEKYRKAALWNIDAVTALWLIDVIKEWKYIQYWETNENGVRSILPRYRVPTEPDQAAPIKKATLSTWPQLQERRCDGSVVRFVMTTVPSGRKEQTISILKRLGAEQASYAKGKPRPTHLITGAFRQTETYLKALCTPAFIVSPEWVVACSCQAKFLDEAAFVPVDLEREKEHGVSLRTVLHRREAVLQNGGLFKNFVIWITKSVSPPCAVLRALVEMAGGSVVTECPPPDELDRFSPESWGGDEDVPPTKRRPRFVVVTCPADAAHCTEMLADRGARFYNGNIILSSILKQKREFNFATYFLVSQDGVGKAGTKRQ